jgi:hypothetical protein
VDNGKPPIAKLHSFGWASNDEMYEELIYIPNEGPLAGRPIATPAYERQMSRETIMAIHPGVIFESEFLPDPSKSTESIVRVKLGRKQAPWNFDDENEDND